MTLSRNETLAEHWQWKQRPEGKESHLNVLADDNGWTATSVPTEILKDLLQSGTIEDPFIDQHEKNVQWVGEVDWLYRARFTVDHVLEAHEKAVLAFDGLDTFAFVYLNGKLILETENMFHEHRVDVTSNLKPGSNDIGIVFESALNKGREEVKKRGNLMCWNGEPSRLYVRKAQYHWGWDWGPVLMSAGPWKPIRLEVFQSRIEELHFPVTVSDDLKSATIDYTITLESVPRNGTVRVDLYDPQESQIKDKSLVYSETLHVNSTTIKGRITIKTPKLWYPVGYGLQSLYTVAVELQKDNSILDSKNQNLGIRRAHVIQNPLKDESGTTFYFEVNNIPIFCGGSNWIPADNILTRLTPQRYREWLHLLVKGNQNMVRVWAGGIYEHDSFYEAADELGILVWQDFLFGCGQYPAHTAFQKNVKREAITQMKRLRHHPSIVLLAGNNEDYQVAEQVPLDWDPSDTNPDNWLKTNFPARYIYEKLLPEVALKYAPGIFYHPGSPWGGGKPTTDKTVGDLHQWNVWHGSQEPYQSFPKLGGRFVSEFGMQALPSHRTITHFITNKHELYPQSQTMDHHNKATGFERRLGAYILENYRLASFDLEEYGRESQRMQADALGEAYRGWRRLWQGPGREITSGALLNDCWPCTSWAIVDYFLRPKLAWYSIARELRPINFAISRSVTFKDPILLPEGPRSKLTDAERLEKNKNIHSTPHAHGEKNVIFDIWGSNALVTEVNVTVTIQFFEISTGKLVKNVDVAVRLLPNQSTEIQKLDWSKNNPSDTVVNVLFRSSTGVNGRSSADWPQPLKYVEFLDRGVKVSVEGEEVTLRAAKPTKGVILDVEGDDDSGLEWSDNGFDIMPGEPIKVTAKGLAGRKVTVNWYGE